MTLTAERIRAALAPRAVWYYEQVGSTNDFALDWLRDGAAAGSVVVADEQLQGRGRMGRTWRTPPGVALAVSVILRPPPDTLSQVSMLGALAIADLCEKVGLHDVGIKWPNDVQVAGRKVSGVLPEAIWDGERLLGVVLGMGVNVRVDFTGTELAETATSIEIELGRPLDRTELLAFLLKRVDYWVEQLGTPAVYDAWKGGLTSVGQWLVVGQHEGRAEGVDDQGALLVRTSTGVLKRIMAGDVMLGQ